MLLPTYLGYIRHRPSDLKVTDTSDDMISDNITRTVMNVTDPMFVKREEASGRKRDCLTKCFSRSPRDLLWIENMTSIKRLERVVLSQDDLTGQCTHGRNGCWPCK